MRIISDFHTHSRFAMACSSAITVQGMDETARYKGINLLGTGDFTHPAWLAELRSALEPAESGLFRLRGSASGVRFVLSSEVSTVFSDRSGSKRIHNCVLMPSFDAVEAFNAVLSRKGDLSADGRSQVSMTAAELVEEALRADRGAFVFPAHAWTPFFGVLGTSTGFNTMKDAYQDQEKHIYALETGLSSDPAMNWRISALDKYALLSNSDMHSLPKMGRETNLFELTEKELSYATITKAIREKDKSKFKMTVEFYPEEGKYHFDGHRQCMVSVDPDKDRITACPICGKKLVVGVMHRIIDLADREPGYVPSGAIPYISAVPLREVLAYTMRKMETSVAVEREYRKMVMAFGTEFDALVNAELSAIKEVSTQEVADAIKNVRENKVNIVPGYDGVFGKVDLLGREGKGTASSAAWRQKTLGAFK